MATPRTPIPLNPHLNGVSKTATRQVVAANSKSTPPKPPRLQTTLEPKHTHQHTDRPPGLLTSPQPGPPLSNQIVPGATSATAPNIFEKSSSRSTPIPNNPMASTYTKTGPVEEWPKSSALKKRSSVQITSPHPRSAPVAPTRDLEDSIEDKSGDEPLSSTFVPPMTILCVDDYWACRKVKEESSIAWPIPHRPTESNVTRDGDKIRLEGMSLGFSFLPADIREVQFIEASEKQNVSYAPFVFIHGVPSQEELKKNELKIPPDAWFVLRVKAIADGDFPVIGSTVMNIFRGSNVSQTDFFRTSSMAEKLGDATRVLARKPPAPGSRQAAKQSAAAKRTAAAAKSQSKRMAPKQLEAIAVDADDEDTLDGQPDAGLPKKSVPFAPKPKTSESSDGEYGGGVSVEVAPPRVAQTILVYPQNQPDAVTIVDEDMARLQPNECLNDSLIDFWLRYWYSEILTPEDREKVHVFNTFFFNTMSTGNSGPLKVIRWTNKMDIFKFDYIIMPVNQSFHWRLAVVCFPRYIKLSRQDKAAKKYLPTILVLDSMGASNGGVAPATRAFFELEHDKPSRKDYPWPLAPPESLDDAAAPLSQENVVDTTNTSTEDGRQCSVVITAEDQAPPAKKGKKGSKADASKTEDPRVFNIKSMPIFSPHKLPKQENFTDCGVYLLCYAEEFVKNPPPAPSDKGSVERHFEEHMKHITPDVINQKRKLIRDTIFRLANKSPEQIAEIDRINGVTRAVIVPDATQDSTVKDITDVDLEVPSALPTRRSTRSHKPLRYTDDDDIEISEQQQSGPDHLLDHPEPTPEPSEHIDRNITLAELARNSRNEANEEDVILIQDPSRTKPMVDPSRTDVADPMETDIFTDSSPPGLASSAQPDSSPARANELAEVESIDIESTEAPKIRDNVHENDDEPSELPHTKKRKRTAPKAVDGPSESPHDVERAAADEEVREPTQTKKRKTAVSEVTDAPAPEPNRAVVVDDQPGKSTQTQKLKTSPIVIDEPAEEAHKAVEEESSERSQAKRKRGRKARAADASDEEAPEPQHDDTDSVQDAPGRKRNATNQRKAALEAPNYAEDGQPKQGRGRGRSTITPEDYSAPPRQTRSQKHTQTQLKFAVAPNQEPARAKRKK